MKKILAITFSTILIFCFTSCSGNINEEEKSYFIDSDQAFTRPSDPEVTVSVPDSWK